MSSSWFVKIGNKIAIAEVTFMTQYIANDYIDMSKNKLLVKQSKEAMQESNAILFFNRLNVPEQIRNLGYGKKLLKEILSFCDTNNYFLINTANNYGDMGQNNLINFYIKQGMTLLHDDGLLVYHQSISNNLNIETPKKVKPR